MPEDNYYLPQEDYIGTGFGFPLQVNVQGGIQLSTGTPNLEESIVIILRTDLGNGYIGPILVRTCQN